MGPVTQETRWAPLVVSEVSGAIPLLGPPDLACRRPSPLGRAPGGSAGAVLHEIAEDCSDLVEMITQICSLC